jgi:hypothetical protein
VASTVSVSRTRDVSPGEPFFVLDDIAGQALHDSPGRGLVTAILPWGTDTVFNRFQVPTLLSEIRAVAAAVDDSDVSEQLARLATFLDEHVPAENDAYVIFVAD